MARVKVVLKPGDFPGTPGDKDREDLTALFDHMFPGNDNPEIPGTAAAFGVVAQDPQLALRLIRVSDYIVREMAWTSTRRDLQQLMVQVVNYHFKCDFSFQAHIKPAAAVGLSAEQQALIPYWQTANVFDDEQRLVIEYTLAVVTGTVPEDLFKRVVDHFGERPAIAFTTGIGWWSMWAMLIGATRPEFDFGFAKPKA